MNDITNNNGVSIISEFHNNTISDEEMRFASWVLKCVYGWELKKVTKFKLSSLRYWIKKAKKRMTVGDLIAINTFFKPKKKKLWKKLTKN